MRSPATVSLILRTGWVALLAGCVAACSLPSFGPLPGVRQPQEVGRLPDAAPALERAIAALSEQPSFEVGDVWVLKQLLRLRPDPRLDRLVERWTAQLATDPFAGILQAGAPRTPLPEDPGTGLTRLYHYILAPVGRSESRAVRFITDFVSHEERGYVLTHQWLVLEWARQVGLELPQTTTRMRTVLLERIAREQSADPRFSDLFAERAGILLAYAEPRPESGAAWVDTLLGAQLPGGGWEDPRPGRMVYDGQKLTTRHSPSHTTAWSGLALAGFLSR